MLRQILEGFKNKSRPRLHKFLLLEGLFGITASLLSLSLFLSPTYPPNFNLFPFP